ncbi:MAG: hypothetical protein A3H93_18110 [Rhodocyclales bacterium RIFCSPLOWO2_02_FULL_63_24]|nr:MAG: hypothetical protein A3H93_18110 [Rhodocyclales bacterium RIFCSPLOWO2_02_FULL_63_24]
MLAAMVVILARCICVVPRLGPRRWTGHRAHFLALSGTYALMGGGAVGTALHLSWGPLLLMLAVSGWVIFDRRKPR